MPLARGFGEGVEGSAGGRGMGLEREGGPAGLRKVDHDRLGPPERWRPPASCHLRQAAEGECGLSQRVE
eukprot:3768849-Pyramimonas_sp.AAC.1